MGVSALKWYQREGHWKEWCSIPTGHINLNPKLSLVSSKARRINSILQKCYFPAFLEKCQLCKDYTTILDLHYLQRLSCKIIFESRPEKKMGGGVWSAPVLFQNFSWVSTLFITVLELNYLGRLFCYENYLVCVSRLISRTYTGCGVWNFP